LSNESISFNLDGNKIDCEKEVKLLGVTIDCQLKFNTHISNICKKASRQLNVLKRIGKHLTKLLSFKVFEPMAIAWNLSGFAFIWLWENQWIKFKLSFSKIFLSQH
jgi:hypothetical protein